MAVRRKVRAGIKRQHKIGSDSNAATPADIENYKKEQKETLNKPGEASQDIFTNHLVEIKTLMGDENIGEIEDLKWIEGLFSIATGIPQALLSGGRETATNFTVIKEQEEDYLRVIGDIDEVLEEAFVQIFDFALMLKGINSDSVVYTFNWGAKDREDIDRKVLRAERLQGIGYSPLKRCSIRWIWTASPTRRNWNASGNRKRTASSRIWVQTHAHDRKPSVAWRPK